MIPFGAFRIGKMFLFMFNVFILFAEFFMLIGQIYAIVFEMCKQLIFPVKRKSVQGKKVLITGAGGCIGRELAIKFSRLGATIIVLDRNKHKGEETVAQVRQRGGIAFFFEVDVSNYAWVGDALDKVYQTVGPVDIAINNAGILNARPITRLSEEMVAETIKVNLLGQMWVTKQILPRMVAEKQGHIVAIASNSAIFGKTFLTDYSSSKAGVIGFMSALEEELRYEKKDYIKLTTICPAAIDTGLSAAVETRFPRLLPILNVQKAADIMIENILREEPFVIMPLGYKILYYILRNLPYKIEILVRDFIGNTVEAKPCD
ncbi:epidermal retinol dehydrogenase 2 [Tetranychus urticae]|nr:epidermal retinol dehydrogenase 2 [Tetranychus urticae]XP_025017461.1 epidermal retinol dehydrogenase 2 [Tetranychus urticae]